MGRPPKLSASIQERIVSGIRSGNYAVQAAAAAGVHRSTYYRWLERGKEASSGKYRDFFEAVERANGEAEVSMVAIIRKAAIDKWLAAAWLLERRFPQRWARRYLVDVEQFLPREAEKLAREQGKDPTALLAKAKELLEDAA